MNKEAMKRYFEAYNGGNFTKVIAEYYADDAIFETTHIKCVGKQEIINFMEKSHRMIGEKLIPLNILVDGDKIAAEFEVEFNVLQDNPDFHLKPIIKGERFKMKMAAFYNVPNDRIRYVKVYHQGF